MSDDVIVQDLLPVEPKPSGRPLGMVAFAIVALLAAGAFALAYLLPGNNSPEDAVRSLVTALTEEDLLGALDAVAPSERDLVRGAIVEVADELRRLEVLDKDADLSGVDGIDLEIDDLALTAQSLGEGVSLVAVEGTATLQVDPGRLPVGSFIDAQMDGDVGEPVSETQPIKGLSLVAVEEGGRWYVSLLYSVADAVRRDADVAPPDFGNGVRPVGASSPEAAVRALLDAAGALDARRAIGLLPPDEARALYDYAPLFLDDIEEAAAEARSSFSLKVKTFDVTVDRDGDEAVVKIDRIGIAASYEGDDVSVEYDGKCFTFVEEGEEQESCGEGGGIAPLFFVPFAGLTDAGDDEEGAGAGPGIDFGIVAVERDGKWYVSPIRTVLLPVLDSLRAMERQDLDKFFGGLTTSETETIELGSPDGGFETYPADDRFVQFSLRNALVAFKAASTETGEWTADTHVIVDIEPGVDLIPYPGYIPPRTIVFEVDGTTLRLAARGESGGCYYLADDHASVTYATDPGCGTLSEQPYSPQSWR